MLNLKRRGARFAVGGAVVASALGLIAGSVPSADAATTLARNHLIIGSGSSTTYNMMQSMDTLFNDSLGCYMTQPSNLQQTLNFSCAGNNEGQQVGESYSENPFNDVAFEEPALGSSAGIQQLEYSGPGSDGTTIHAAPVNFARSSRSARLEGSSSSPDEPGLNFVAYATDGVSWLTFPSINGKPTASAGIGNLTSAQLANIWNGKTTNWDQIPGHKGSGSICVYVAQTSSGTESTWASALEGSGGPTALNAYVNSNPKLSGCKVPTGSSYGASHTIFENETRGIVANGDEGNAIFFFSWGKYQVLCHPGNIQHDCNGGLANTVPYFGKINGITATATTILCDTSACTTPFPVTRDLYNVYSNGSFSPTKSAEFGYPAANPATINYVSEIGFVCKPQIDTKKAQTIDANTGTWYRTEIDSVIVQSGFLPFPLQTKGEDANSVDTPATAVLKAEGDKSYSLNDPITNSTTAANEANGDPVGYCMVWTTDGNPAP
jgi:ABC-type phosphate transport system substrate-binding protein